MDNTKSVVVAVRLLRYEILTISCPLVIIVSQTWISRCGPPRYAKDMPFCKPLTQVIVD